MESRVHAGHHGAVINRMPAFEQCRPGKFRSDAKTAGFYRQGRHVAENHGSGAIYGYLDSAISR